MIIEITHNDKPLASGINKKGIKFIGRLVESYGDYFIVIRKFGINDYNKIETLSIKLL